MPEVSKIVVVAFEGGFKDGRRARSDSDDPDDVQEAIGHYFMSGEGTVGRQFQCASEAALLDLEENIEIGPDGEPRLKWEPIYQADHVYELAERIEDDETITLRFRYLGKIDPGGSS